MTNNAWGYSVVQQKRRKGSGKTDPRSPFAHNKKRLDRCLWIDIRPEADKKALSEQPLHFMGFLNSHRQDAPFYRQDTDNTKAKILGGSIPNRKDAQALSAYRTPHPEQIPSHIRKLYPAQKRHKDPSLRRSGSHRPNRSRCSQYHPHETDKCQRPPPLRPKDKDTIQHGAEFAKQSRVEGLSLEEGHFEQTHIQVKQGRPVHTRSIWIPSHGCRSLLLHPCRRRHPIIRRIHLPISEVR